MKTAGALLAALALAACGGEATPAPVQQPLSCVDASHRAIYGCVQLWGTGSTRGPVTGSVEVGVLAGGPYICRAEISNNIGISPEKPTAPGPVRVWIIYSRAASPPFMSDIVEIIDEDAAAAAWGEARFVAVRGAPPISVNVLASPRSRWGLACEPDAAP